MIDNITMAKHEITMPSPECKSAIALPQRQRVLGEVQRTKPSLQDSYNGLHDGGLVVLGCASWILVLWLMVEVRFEAQHCTW
jgi:hypothetical protein